MTSNIWATLWFVHYVVTRIRWILGFDPARMVGEKAYNYFHPEDLLATSSCHTNREYTCNYNYMYLCANLYYSFILYTCIHACKICLVDNWKEVWLSHKCFDFWNFFIVHVSKSEHGSLLLFNYFFIVVLYCIVVVYVWKFISDYYIIYVNFLHSFIIIRLFVCWIIRIRICL